MLKDSYQVSFNQGNIIFSEGEPGDCAYIVEQGTVELVALIQGQSVRLTQFEEGELFGEMSLIDNQLRSGTAIAASDVTLVKISKDYVERNINQSDELVSTLVKVVLNRYREMRSRFEQVANGKSLNEAKIEFESDKSELVLATQRTSSRIQEESNLLNALEQNQLELFYQPIISIKDKSIAGCEALIRWRHPDRGLVPPFEFIGLAEDTGLIVPIGKWIIEEACNARTRFSKHIEDIYVSINLSPKQFEAGDLVNVISSAFNKTEVRAERIYLEITETTLMSDPINIAGILNEIKSLNAIIALDDFGTGYSSFSYLHRFPIDVLKIDQSFVFTMLNNPKSKEIVRTLCTLAKSLDMKAIAEGIERKEDLDLLSTFGAEFGQGYHIAKPMPEAEFLSFIKSYPAS